MFSTSAWERNSALYQEIVAMPFNEALRTGTLTAEQFQHYMIQDARYLEGFARSLALLAAKGTHLDHIARFAAAAQTAILDERSLHTEFFRTFNISDADYKAAEPSPVCDHYVSYLLRVTALESVEVGLAAILPCFWIYSEVGKHIHSNAVSPNPYQAWIDLYSSDAFEQEVRDVIAITDDVAANASETTLEAMHHAFTQAMRLEWMFWDSAYKLGNWQV